MRSDAVVVVPWRGGCAHRDRAWAWVRSRLCAAGYEVVVAEAPPGPWIKAAAVMPAIRASDAEVVVVHDADVWCDGLAEAVEALAGGARWAIPHRMVHRLTEESTERLLGGCGVGWEGLELERYSQHRPGPYGGVRGGGIVVASREALLDVPLDNRFVGWGQEDASWGLALNCLLGRPWVGMAPLVHLWHPPQERQDRKTGSTEGWVLFRRYDCLQANPAAMRQLLEEMPS